MLRIELLFDELQLKNMKPGTLKALREEVEKKLSSRGYEFRLRVEKASSPLVSISGTSNAKEKQKIMDMLEEVWMDDGWLPE